LGTLSGNPNAIHLLEVNQDNLNKIDCDALSTNHNALKLLEANKDKIHWFWFSSNPSIFEINYNTLK